MVDRFNPDVFYSDDHFMTIETMDGPAGGALESVYAFSDDIVLAAGRGGGTLAFYRTTDGGGSWNSVLNAGFIGFDPIYTPGNGGLFVGFEIGYNLQFTGNQGESFTQKADPDGNPGMVFLLATDQDNLVAGRGMNIFRSTDAGDSWTEVYEQADGLLMGGDVGPDGTLYARHTGGTNAYSSDDGQTWTTVQDNYDIFEATNDICVTDGNFIMAGGRGCFVRDGVGDDWMVSNSGLVASTVGSVIASSTGHVAAGTAGGFFHTMAPNGTWTARDEPANTVGMNQNGTMFAGSLNQLVVSTDNGATWTSATGIPEATVRFVLFESPGSYMFANVQGTIPLGLYRSADNGDNWSQLTDWFVNDIAVAANGDMYVVTTTEGFGISTDNGDSWSWPHAQFNQFEVELGPDGQIYRATSESTDISTDGGSSWTDISSNALPDGVDFVNMTVNALGVTGDGTIFMDMDWYSSWPELVTGGAVYISDDEGQSWEAINGWRATSFNHGADGYLYAGTSQGVMRIMSGADVAEADILQPSEYTLRQNYPNPFNPSTSISFSLQQPGHTQLVVYNLTGQRVATLYDGQLSAGLHSARFDAAGLASGVYLYQLSQDGQPALTRRMMLLK